MAQKILWHSNDPRSPTGYGNQSNTFIWRIQDLGYEVIVHSMYGVLGSPQHYRDTLMLPVGKTEQGLDMLVDYHHRFECDLTISLFDAWTYPNDITQAIRWVPWLPVDHDPVPPAVIQALATAYQPIVYSQFGKAQLEAMGLKPLYVPHGVDTKVYQAHEQKAARKALGAPEDAFIVGMVAANKGNPSRKAFDQHLRAFKMLMDKHEDALLYLHTDFEGNHGVKLDHLINLIGIPQKRVAKVDQFRYITGVIGAEEMSEVYSSMDVLMNATMGEGFGIPIIEAQACGVPVIVGNWTAMPELVRSGTTIEYSDKFFSPQGSYQFLPSVPELYEKLELAYSKWRGNQDMREQARAGMVKDYDADVVTETHWKPVLAEIMGRVESEKTHENVVTILNAPVADTTPEPEQEFTYDVSVIMPVFNGMTAYDEDELKDAIQSSLDQEGVKVQVCICDDASDDKLTAKWLADTYASHEDVVVSFHDTNKGSSEAANTAASTATGRYFIIQSVRSKYAPGAFRKMVSALKAVPDVGFVYGDTTYWGKNERIHQPGVFRRDAFYKEFPSLFGYMYRREAWDAGARYTPYLTVDDKVLCVGDWDFAMQMIFDQGLQGFYLPNETTLIYHYTGNQMTDLVHQHSDAIRKQFEKRWKDKVHPTPQATPEPA